MDLLPMVTLQSIHYQIIGMPWCFQMAWILFLRLPYSVLE